jgi:hypothetical protein
MALLAQWLRPELYDKRLLRATRSPRYSLSFGPYINKPAGKGERFIILNAVTKDGWVQNAQLVFQAHRRTGDDHGAMDEDNFSKWFMR